MRHESLLRAAANERLHIGFAESHAAIVKQAVITIEKKIGRMNRYLQLTTVTVEPRGETWVTATTGHAPPAGCRDPPRRSRGHHCLVQRGLQPTFTLPTCSKAIDEVTWRSGSACAMKAYCSCAYSALASFRMGMSGRRLSITRRSPGMPGGLSPCPLATHMTEPATRARAPTPALRAKSRDDR